MAKEQGGRYSSIRKFDLRTWTMVGVLIALWLFFTYMTSNGLQN
jgi:ABC-type xylose transport system permease subunit